MKKLDSVFNECIMNAINSVVNCLLHGKLIYFYITPTIKYIVSECIPPQYNS